MTTSPERKLYMNHCYNNESPCSLLTHSLCVGDVSPAGLCQFGRWSMVLPRHKHICGKFDVPIVFGQGEQRTAAWVALWQGQSQVCVLCLERRKCLHVNNHANSYFMSKK